MSPICSIDIPSREKSPSSSTFSSKWAEDIIKDGSKLGSSENGRPKHDGAFYLPNLSIVLENGDAKLLVTPQDSHPFDLSDLESQYPSHFRIPPATLVDLSLEECITRARDFALGSMVFALMTGKSPFANLNDGFVQQNFKNGIYPPETMRFPMEISIPVLGCWSREFAEAMKEQIGSHAPSIGQTPLRERMLNHAKSHPVKTGIVGTGALVFVTASFVNPVLAIAGFSFSGPVAASAAAAWQSSIGLVQTGSFFAWCQSAAMGGTAAGAILGAQGLGASAIGIGVVDWLRRTGMDEQEAREMVWNLFLQNVRKVR